MNVGVFGATGQVGGVMRQVLIERSFPVSSIRFFASARSAGQTIDWKGEKVPVEDVASATFDGIDIALLSIGADASREYAPRIAAAGAVVVDNSSAWRMDPEVPLVVAGVNDDDLASVPKQIVANPNCTTMVAMMVVKPLQELAGLESIVASTYQAVSGAGLAGVRELADQVGKVAPLSQELAFSPASVDFPEPSVFAAPIAFNVLPLAGKLIDSETSEEHKLRDESRKILHLPELAVSCMCVRVPVMTGHSLSLNLGFERPISVDEAAVALSKSPGVRVVDVPTPLEATGRDECLVGRIRPDPTSRNGLALFVSGDNLRKGAALNAVQVAERLVGSTG
jgi:aspartate-semialdehyde dehydrogenase